MADGNGESGYKPVVQEENGELSMSIEETNRLRASLGLKPLAVSRCATRWLAGACQSSLIFPTNALVEGRVCWRGRL